MLDLSKIKMIIWDLDETLWHGTISEESITVPVEIRKFIDDTMNMGIVHSICSKNDFENTKEKLTELELWDCFVFPSIDWNPKGSRIKTIIDKMALRYVNVLFVDDNIQNLKEAAFFCNGILTALPLEINPLFEVADKAEKKDKTHKRLKQYRILEEKDNVKGKFDSNTDFLMSCGIKVEINRDCIGSIERIHELLMRSNQLNYTKYRQPIDELKDLIISKDVDCGTVSVKDNYGDYGICGFFAVKDGKAIHYLFSCRTLGMLVEQYVYMKIGCPDIVAKGDVVTKLNKTDVPEWINNETQVCEKSNKSELGNKVLFKGPCDLLQIFSFIKKSENIVTEFTYTNSDGVLVEGQNHTGSIVTALTHSPNMCDDALLKFKWLDSKMLTTALKNNKFDFVFLSMLTDCNLGLYRRKETGEMISLCENYYDLTDIKNRKGYIDGTIYTSNIKFTENELGRFAKEYEYMDNSDASITIENLDIIYRFIDKNSKFVLLMGSEIPCLKDNRDSYKNRHLIHKTCNRKIEEWAKGKENVVLINLGKYIEGEDDYVDSINHFTKKVYYKMAEDVVNVINEGKFDLRVKKPSAIALSSIKDIIKKVLHRA